MGLGQPPKFDAARRLAAALGYLALAALDRVGVAAFAGSAWWPNSRPAAAARRRPQLFRFLDN